MSFHKHGSPFALLLGASALASIAGSPLAAAESEFNEPGNYLIADQFNNRVIEVARDGRIVWQFGRGPTDFSAASIIGVNDAQRVGSLTLMAGTGTPGGQPEAPSCTNSNGCPDNRVLLVNRHGRIVWQYGQFGIAGSDPGLLNTPVQNTWLPNGDILITDQANERIIEVNRAKQIVWQYGMTGVVGNGPEQLNNPNCAELLESGHILICDENNNRAIEVTHNSPSTIFATFTAHGTVSGVAFASRLSNGNTLITDSNNARIVEVDSTDTPVWQYFTNARPSSNASPLPTRAVRLANGNTLISDQFNDQVIEITTTTSPTIVASYGTINTPGYSPSNANVINAPYSAYVIGDYTGLTVP